MRERWKDKPDRGAGAQRDAGCGAALPQLVKLESLDALTAGALERILVFANKAAAITTSRHGAIPAMPTLAEVKN